MLICESRVSRTHAVRACIFLSAATGVHGEALNPQTAPLTLSPYMNSIPPSKDYFCVGLGGEANVRHPDRAPHTNLATQGGVVLFSGAAPQQGLNFALRAGSLVYRNQMSTLGSPEPSPQVGSAGALKQRGAGFFLPWSEARWHPGEDITWQGHRVSPYWIEGMAFWEFYNPNAAWTENDPFILEGYDSICGQADALQPNPPHAPVIKQYMNGVSWNMDSSVNLQLARGLYQASHIRAGWRGNELGLCPQNFREPWLQAEGKYPTFNKILDVPSAIGSNLHLGAFYPNYLNIYTYEQLELDGGLVTIDFERSATWPRQATTLSVSSSQSASTVTRSGGAFAGTSFAEVVRDQYDNRVTFDRVPEYGWETDAKVPHASRHAQPYEELSATDPDFANVPVHYPAVPNAYRLPHKRLRTVQLRDASPDGSGGDESDWIVAFVFEHPESDRLSTNDGISDGAKHRSLYSYLPQSEWDFGRLPDLNDETTLLTVQAYKAENLNITSGNVPVNGAPFQDDYSVWGSAIGAPTSGSTQRLNTAPLCDASATCSPASQNPGSDPPGVGSWSEDNEPGLAGVDDDNDGLIDEDSNGYMKYLDVAPQDCATCQTNVFRGINTGSPLCWSANDRTKPRQTYTGTCKNPLFWKGTWAEGSQTWSPGAERLDPLAVLDDDEDGLIDEDGDDDPLLIHFRQLDDQNNPIVSDDCASGEHPFIPAATADGSDPARATFPGDSTTEHCRPVYAPVAQSDPWTHQVQYVYARSNPHWLLVQHKDDGTPSYLSAPRYKYFPPFEEPWEDADGDGEVDADEDLTKNGSLLSFDMTQAGVHPDCLPNPDFRGPQGRDEYGADLEPVAPGEIQLIKRIVRTRPDVSKPNQFIEQTWLYRYNDFGFLKAVFDPASIQAILDADSSLETPDDILKLADRAIIGTTGKPLIVYASQWYTYYNPYVLHDDAPEQCYENPPFVADCYSSFGINANSPLGRMPINGCDGETVWSAAGTETTEYHVDPDCSELMKQNCGWCFARYACDGPCDGAFSWQDDCVCPDGPAADQVMLNQLGIPDAQPRFRKYLVKTAYVREADNEMHLYAYDYLGAASSVYTDPDRITSYADPHNITLVDELSLQTENEDASIAAPGAYDRNEFYIYDDDYWIDLDPDTGPFAQPVNVGNGLATVDSHFLHLPVKVKTRRVVVMNYYGIAISDRVLLTPGFDGDGTRLLNDEQYELVNQRGQIKHLYDQSWVAGLRAYGSDYIESAGRVFTELFGGEGGFHSVLSGIARGSDGGNLYNQQCKTPEVLEDVPVQRVSESQVVVARATKHLERQLSSSVCTAADADCVKDVPALEVVYNKPISLADSSFDIVDPANTISDSGGGASQCTLVACGSEAEANCYCETDSTGTEVCWRGELDSAEIDLSNQEPVAVNAVFGEAGTSNDGAQITRYHYVYYPEETGVFGPDERIKVKYRWSEEIAPAEGGTGGVALEVWEFDENGRICFYGKGSGNDSVPPVPQAPFYVDAYGYDDIGRLVVQIADFDPAGMALSGSFIPNAPTHGRVPLAPGGTATNLGTVNRYDDAGMLVSRYVGTIEEVPGPTDFTGADGVASGVFPEITAGVHDVVRTDYAVIANRNITYKDTDDKWKVGWTDPYDYVIEYQHANSNGTEVHGTTTVQMLDQAGRLVEERVIAWNDARDPAERADKIEDFGWGVSLDDYDSDGAIAQWDAATQFGGPLSELVDPEASCSPASENYPFCGPTGGASVLWQDMTPAYPEATAGENSWPPPADEQVVTLARSFRLYDQASTLKPTAEVVHSGFEDATSDREQVVRSFLYDLEDRIARQQEPDGTVSRFLFDPKRRPTKIYRGSNDTDPSWFPSSPLSTGTDDMVLTEHLLYNDGDETCEHSSTVGLDACTTINANPNFPNNAGKLVRRRNYVENAEPPGGSYEPDTASRDARFLYDWRGRPVIVEEVAIQFDMNGTASTFTNPKYINTTSTVFNNLDQPLLVATWGDGDAPTVSEVETWADAYNPASPFALAATILAEGPLTLSQTVYDDRGRPYESRTYNVDDATGATYNFTRTYRDDLDRVIAEDSPGGFVTNTYDPLGRVTSTSLWTKEGTTQGAPGGVELTRTDSDYDVWGNLVRQVSYERDSLNNQTGNELTTANAYITYTCNWYDSAKRLAATAYYGSNGASFFDNSSALTTCPTAPPLWDGSDYKDGTTSLNGVALVSRYGYDRAGRRIWMQDAMGRVTRTWYDLLGRTLLEAENWHDDKNLAPSADTNADLTPNHDGPIRYTAYHYTKGGLMDAIVAVIPNTEDANITPGDIEWGDDEATGDNPDYAVYDVAMNSGAPTASFQATRFVYGTPRSTNMFGNVIPEITAPETGDAASTLTTLPNLVTEIYYPDPSDGSMTGGTFAEDGDASAAERVQLQYTIDGRLAERFDQRGVRLHYEYGTHWSSPGGTQLSAIDVFDFGPSPLKALDRTVQRLEFVQDDRGQLKWAYSRDSTGGMTNRVGFDYDGMGNLIAEKMHHDGVSGPTGSTLYDWATGTNLNRLHQITYPRGTVFELDYGTSTASSNLIHKPIGIKELKADGTVDIVPITYDYTGSGRRLGQTLGTAPTASSLSLANPSDDPGLDRFGRITDITVNAAGTDIHHYEYRYDANGNRTIGSIAQIGCSGGTCDNPRGLTGDSYLYRYDRLDRLTKAERGTLAADLSKIASDAKDSYRWHLDVLGNWSGNDGASVGLERYEPDDDPDTDAEGSDLEIAHDRDGQNRVTSIDVTIPGTPPTTETTTRSYASNGELRNDGNRAYKWDAFGRLTQILDNFAIGQPLAKTTFAYDALGRRTQKHVTDDPNYPTAVDRERFFYDGNRIIAHQYFVPSSGGGGGGLPCPQEPCGGGGPGPVKAVEGSGKLVEGAESPRRKSRFFHTAPHPERPAQLAALVDDPKAQPLVKGTVNYSTTTGWTWLWEYLYGFEYIDEVVMGRFGHDAPARVFYFQDANWNVVASVEADGTPLSQHRYSPYGEMLSYTNLLTGFDLLSGEGEGFDGGLIGLPVQHGHQGLFHDWEKSLLINNRFRPYSPKDGRFLTQDPNGSGLIAAQAIVMNGGSPRASAQADLTAQFGDGPNLYQYLRSQPGLRTDPAGLLSGLHRFVADVLISATMAYAFAMDAGVYALLEDGPEGSSLDAALESLPNAVAGAVVGGAVAYGFGWSPAGNVFGASIAGGINTQALGYGFTPGMVAASEVAVAVEGTLMLLTPRQKRGIVVGAGAAGARNTGGVLRALRARGMIRDAFYSRKSARNVWDHGHRPNGPRLPNKSRFYPTEGGARFMREVLDHPQVRITNQTNGRIRYHVPDLGRKVGTNTKGGASRGGTVIVENEAKIGRFQPGEVVTMYPE